MNIETDELRLLLDWRDRERERRSVRAGIASVLLHAAGVSVLFFAPWSDFAARQTHARPDLSKATPLIAPPREITQKAPNRGKISKEFNLESLLPRPPLRLPPAAARRVAPPPIAEPPKIEPPKLAESLPPPELAGAPAPPPPQIQTEEKPKLAFERPGSAAPPRSAPTGKVPLPNSSVDEAIRSAARGVRSGGLVVGDAEAPPGIGEGLTLPPAIGRTGSSLELLSDPMGADFRPYLIKILYTVRRNWMAVIPEVARLGYRGRVQIQFAISRDGKVPKLVIALPSGIDAFDRAAVAGISASNPFPPLPSDFRGEQVKLQFTFLYNMPR